MNSSRKPWHRTTWGLILALIFSPFWFIWKKSRRSRFWRTTVGACAALLVFILVVIPVGHILAGKPNNTVDNNDSRPTLNPNATIVLHGYGALQADWNTTHTADNGLPPNTAYDPTAGLGNGYTDKYGAVIWVGGRALGYQVGFPNGTSLTAAKSAAMQEFPVDTAVLWQRENTSDSVNICYQMEIRSAILGQALNSDGDAFVEFQTIEASDTSSSVGYYPNNVNSATLRNADYKNASSVGGC